MQNGDLRGDTNLGSRKKTGSSEYMGMDLLKALAFSNLHDSAV